MSIQIECSFVKAISSWSDIRFYARFTDSMDKQNTPQISIVLVYGVDEQGAIL